jgi:hypothetical protein
LKYLRPGALRLPPEVLAKLYTYGWNRRRLTYDLFEDFCANENIVVAQRPLPEFHPGEYKLVNGRDYIKLDPNLRGHRLTLTAWHEAGHALLHTPGKFGSSKKTETEADFIGYAALIPLYLVKHFSDWEIAEEYGYPLQYCRERRTLRDIFGY